MDDFDLQAVLSRIMTGEKHEPVEILRNQDGAVERSVLAVDERDPDQSIRDGSRGQGGLADSAGDALVMTAPAVTTVVTDEADDGDATPAAAALKFPTFTEENLAETMDIRNYATLCKLKVRKWGGRVKDKKAAHRSSQEAGAVDGAFSTYKKLFAGVEDKLRAVNSVLDAARTRHYEMTMPWSVTGVDDRGRRDGPRLLANTLFMEYITEMGAAKQQTKAVLADLKTAYPSMILEAKRNLGTGFDIKQYPTSEEIEDYFDLEFEFMPVPAGADYKGLPQQQVSALASKLNKSMQQCMENACKDVWARAYTVIHKMAERLSNPKHLFHDTLVSNVHELAALLEHLNPTNNPHIDDVRKRMENDLCRFEPEVLRKDLMKRALVAKLASELLEEMRGVGVS